MTSEGKPQRMFRSTSIAAAAFNLPVMVIAGLIVGYLLSVNQESPLREIIQIGLPILFFIIAIFELYYTVNRQQTGHISTKSSHAGLTKLIASKEEEEEEEDC